MEEGEEELSPLLTAAKEGEVATFKTLLQEGADVLQADKNHRTVLHWATQAESISIILAGLSYGLSWHVNAKSKRESLTPLHEACLIGHKRITYLFLSLGADVNAKTKEGYTPLLCAAGNGHVEVTKVLLGAGCDGNEIVSPIGINALHIASWTGQANVVKTLLEMGVEVETPSNTEKNKTAIEFAIEQGHTEVMEEIREHRKKLDKGIQDKSFFQTKIMQVGDKIRGYYEETLRQEVEYFEQQMEEQSLKDSQTISALKHEIERLKFGEDPAMKSNIPLRRKGATLNAVSDLNILQSKGQSNGRRKVIFPSVQRFAALNRIDESDQSDPESDLEDRRETPSGSSDSSIVSSQNVSPTVGVTSPVVGNSPRSKNSQQKTMSDLVTAVEQKESSMTNLRRQESLEEGNDRWKTSPRQESQKDKPRSPKRVTFSPSTALETPSYTPLKRVEENIKPNTLSPKDADPPRRRRKSIAEFFRSSTSADKQEDAPVRRKSVASRMMSQPMAPSKPKPTRNSFSMLHFPLPGIQTKDSSREDELPPLT